MSTAGSSIELTDTTYLYDVSTDTTQDVASLLNISDAEKRRYLSHLDDVMFHLKMPTVIYLSTSMFLGIIGNIMVLIVYLKKFKPSPTRVFIVSLAIFDLMTCTISIPGEILDMRHTYTFVYPNLCKFLRFSGTFCIMSSALTLIYVAIERYRKICHPLKRQITIRVSRIMVAITMAVSVVLTIPTVIMNGQMTVITDQEGITGVDCSFEDRWRKTIFPLVYNGVLFLAFFVSLSVFIVIYMLIIKTVFTRRKFKLRPISTKQESKHGPRMSKTTLMLFIITAVFTISFLPYHILMTTRGFNPTFLESLQGRGIIVYNVFLRSYYINSAANCIVYSFCNIKFRNECKRLLCPYISSLK